MPYRNTPLINGEYYHVFNKGIAGMPLFLNKSYYKRFIKSMLYYQVEGPKPKYSIFAPTTNILDYDKKIIEIICFCLMPNHYHFLLKQIKDGGVSEFLRKLANSYAKYYNVRQSRNGSVFQGEFKAVLMENNEQLIHVSRYIHLNPLVAGLVDDLDNYQWSSYREYLDQDSTICSKSMILDQFKSIQDYKQFILNQAEYGRELEIIKHHLLDNE